MEDAVKQLQVSLDAFRAQSEPGTQDEWLRTLYENYHKRFLQDNLSIWGNGKVIIPFSLSAFAVFVSLECPSFLQTLILGVASSGLLLLWLVNAENHRAFQNKSLAWMIAIEKTIGLNSALGSKIPDGKMNRLLSSATIGRRVIRLLCTAVPAAWICLLIWQVIC